MIFLNLLRLDCLHYARTVEIDLHFKFLGSAKSAKGEVDFGRQVCNWVKAWHWDGNLCLVQVDGMDVLSVKQACKFAKDHVLENGPIVSISEITLIFLVWMHIMEHIIHHVRG